MHDYMLVYLAFCNQLSLCYWQSWWNYLTVLGVRPCWNTWCFARLLKTFKFLRGTVLNLPNDRSHIWCFIWWVFFNACSSSQTCLRETVHPDICFIHAWCHLPSILCRGAVWPRPWTSASRMCECVNMKTDQTHCMMSEAIIRLGFSPQWTCSYTQWLNCIIAATKRRYWVCVWAVSCQLFAFFHSHIE